MRHTECGEIGHAASLPGRERLTPVGLFGCQVDHAQGAFVVPVDFAPQVERIPVQGRGHLVAETLLAVGACELVHRAPGSRGDPRPAGNLDGRKCDLLQGNRHMLNGQRMIEIMLEIVVTRPYRLDGCVHLLGNESGFLGIVRLQAAPEATADQRHVDDHLLWLKTGDSRYLPLHILGALCGSPDLTAAIVKEGRAVHRFHGCVCLVGT